LSRGGLWFLAGILALPVGAAPAAETEESASVTFLTNRNVAQETDRTVLFGNRLGSLAAGRCHVELGEGERDTHLLSAERLTPEAALDTVTRAPEEGTVVYIHGYYEDFERACRRAAIFKDRLGDARDFLLFTWPANSTPLTYGADVEDLLASVAQLTEVLERLGERIGPGRISIIGHSLGSRGLMRSLEAPAPTTEKFRDLILIAADVDRDRFREVLPAIKARVERVTVLVSDHDLALRASQLVNRAPRLGQAAGADLGDVERIDVSAFESTHLSGHIYHLRNDQVIDAIRRVLASDP